MNRALVHILCEKSKTDHDPGLIRAAWITLAGQRGIIVRRETLGPARHHVVAMNATESAIAPHQASAACTIRRLIADRGLAARFANRMRPVQLRPV